MAAKAAFIKNISKSGKENVQYRKQIQFEDSFEKETVYPYSFHWVKRRQRGCSPP